MGLTVIICSRICPHALFPLLFALFLAHFLASLSSHGGACEQAQHNHQTVFLAITQLMLSDWDPTQESWQAPDRCHMEAVFVAIWCSSILQVSGDHSKSCIRPTASLVQIMTGALDWHCKWWSGNNGRHHLGVCNH